MSYAVFVFLALAGRTLLLRHHLRRYERVSRCACGPLRTELYRRTYLAATVPGEFPHPLEERVIAWQLWGLPLWTRRSIIGLPGEVDRRIDHIAAAEFDRHFGARFRIDAQPPARPGSGQGLFSAVRWLHH